MKIDAIEFANYLSYYSLKEIQVIADKLSSIVSKYDNDLLVNDSSPRLFDKASELLKVMLTLAEHYAQYYKQSNLNHASYKPVSQLQELKNVLTKTNNRHIVIDFKIPGKTFKADDPIVSKWIRTQLLKAYNEFDITADFGEAMFLLDSENNPLQNDEKSKLLGEYAIRPTSFGKVVFLFCNGMITYMAKAFSLRPHEAKYLSGAQLSFLYELLALMGFDGFAETLSVDEKPLSYDIDKLYAMLNLQYKLKR